MKKMGKSSKKGFTLVELIVVLVILAVLAAMLVPALTGYVKRAREEKDYQAAATVLTAVQSLATEQYAKSDTVDTSKITKDKVAGLAGVKINTLTVTTVTDGIVEKFSVSFDGTHTYTYNGQDADPMWTVS